MSKNNRLGKNSFKSFSKGQLTIFIILFVLTFIAGSSIPVLLSSNVLFSVRTTRDYSLNELSDEDLISPISFSYINEVETERQRKVAETKVIPYFTYSYSASLRMINKAEKIYSYIVDGTEFYDESLEDVSSLLEHLRNGDDREENASVLRETVSYFVQNGIFSHDDLMYMVNQGYDTMYINESKELPYTYKGEERDIEDVTDEGDVSGRAYKYIVKMYPQLDTTEVRIIADIVDAVKESNIFYDEIYTESLRETARNSVEPVVVTVEKGDYILKVDTLVTEDAISTIDILNSKRVSSMSFTSAFPRFLIVFLILNTWFLYSINLIPYEYRKAQYTIISLSIILLSLLVGFFLAWKIIDLGYSAFDSLLPFLVVAMVGVAMTNSIKYGISNIIALGALYTLWPNASFFSIIYYVISGLVVITFVHNCNGRFDIISTCFKCCGIMIVVTLFLTLLNSSGLYTSLFLISGIILNVIFSFILYSIVMPILEKAFNIPTKERLIELAYTDNATLTQLSIVAQGTYNHVKTVADLAYNAAKAVGCNAELTLVGARYHDIGKMVHPEYFVENQADKNAHDTISNQLSSSIIKSHVRLGTEKGKEIGLPQEVLDIIAEHHGNDIIRYFYNEAVKNAGENNTVAKEDFMYDGNPPSSKESAIVMIADCVEAATRTIKKPNHQKYEKFINTIVIEKIAHGQLDNSGLTMNDLKLIKASFIPTLIGRDHHRISYDKDDKE